MRELTAMSGDDIRRAVTRIAHEIVEHNRGTDDLVFVGMLTRGVYLAPSQYEAGFMSLAHTDTEINQTIAAAAEAFAECR